jgi:nitroreductase
MNKQPLEFIIIDNKQICNNIFSKILWWIKNKTNKVFSDKNYSPVAYIAILHNKTILEKWFKYDVWACAENIMIYANSLWIWSVWLHSILKIDIIDILNIPKDIYNLDSLIWLWYPSHNSNITSLNSKWISYYIDGKLNLFVPKRDINKITHINKY